MLTDGYAAFPGLGPGLSGLTPQLAALPALPGAAARRAAEQRARTLAAVVESTTDAILQIDLASRVITAWNRGAELTFGIAAEEAVGRRPHDVHLPADRAHEADEALATVATGRVFRNPSTLRRRADGTLVHVSVTVSPLRDDAGRVVAAASILRDVSDQVRAEQALAEREHRQRVMLETAREGILMYGPDGRITELNSRCVELLGPAAGPGALLLDVLPQRERPRMRQRLARRRQGVAEQYELQLEDGPGGEERWALVSAAPVMRASGYCGSVATFTDISGHKRAESQLRSLALTDPLTGLANRTLLRDRLEQALRPRRRARSIAVMFADLDGFKSVNDSLGHAAGDELLQALARRIEAAVRPSDTVARLGGDEFAIVCEDVDEAGAGEIADRVIASVRPPLQIAGMTLAPSASVGIALGRSGAVAADLLRDADTAMYHAKTNGHGHWAIFEPAHHDAAVRRFTTISDLRLAVEAGQLALHYQPQLCLSTGEMCGAEALVRWHHPTRGLLTPEHFVPLAEDTGLIADVDEWVAAEAVRQMGCWHRRFGEVATVSLNLSVRDLARPGFSDHLLATLGPAARLHRITVEITETALMHERADGDALLAQLREAGIRISIDDFGTGYASISYLRRFPIDEIKLDRSFVAGIVTDAQDRVIVESLISMAHAVGSSVVAEGVETERQLDVLRELGCDRAQGYHIGRPTSGAELLAAARSRTAQHERERVAQRLAAADRR